MARFAVVASPGSHSRTHRVVPPAADAGGRQPRAERHALLDPVRIVAHDRAFGRRRPCRSASPGRRPACRRSGTPAARRRVGARRLRVERRRRCAPSRARARRASRSASSRGIRGEEVLAVALVVELDDVDGRARPARSSTPCRPASGSRARRAAVRRRRASPAREPAASRLEVQVERARRAGRDRTADAAIGRRCRDSPRKSYGIGAVQHQRGRHERRAAAVAQRNGRAPPSRSRRPARRSRRRAGANSSVAVPACASTPRP